MVGTAPIVAVVISDSVHHAEAKAHASAAAPPARSQSVWMYDLPMGLSQISGSLKIDDPPTKMRIGYLRNFTETYNPTTRTKYWIGITWAEVFYPVVGEKPESVVGAKAYEVVLKQSLEDGGKIVRENLVTTGRFVGVVVADLPHETALVKVEDWFVKSDLFKKGHWTQTQKKVARDHAS